MIISLEQILRDEDVQRAICLIVQAELATAQQVITEKVTRVKLLEQETNFLKQKILGLKKANEKKKAKLRELQEQLQKEKVPLPVERPDCNSGTEGISVQSELKRVVKKKLPFAFTQTPSTFTETTTQIGQRKGRQGRRLKKCKTTSPNCTVSSILSAAMTGQLEANSNSLGSSQISRRKRKLPRKAPYKVVHHIQDTRESGWVCVCGLDFEKKSNMRLHIKYYQTGYNFFCTICSTRFVQATDLRKHLKTVHEVEPDPLMKYGCRVCGSFFMKIQDLTAHRKSAHSAPRRRGMTES